MLATVRIRPAVEADQATIKAMARAARLVPRGLHWPRFLVAEEGGHVVGIWPLFASARVIRSTWRKRWPDRTSRPRNVQGIAA